MANESFSRFLVVFIAMFCSVPAIFSCQVWPRKFWFAISIALMIFLTVTGFIQQNILILLFATSSLATFLSSWLHREYVVRLHSNDEAIAIGMIPFVFLGLEIGDFSSDFLIQMYSAIFQACLATLGIIFAVAVFLGESIQKSDASSVRPLLYGLSKFLLTITITSLIGLIYSNGSFQFGYSVFVQPRFPFGITSPILNLSTLRILVFFFSLIMIFSLAGYLITLLKIILVARVKNDV